MSTTQTSIGNKREHCVVLYLVWVGDGGASVQEVAHAILVSVATEQGAVVGKVTRVPDAVAINILLQGKRRYRTRGRRVRECVCEIVCLHSASMCE